MAPPEPNEMMTCPYNPSHQIEHYKMHVHLQKCRKGHPNCNKVTCIFDAQHVVNDAELEYHLNTCPNRHVLDTQIYVMDDDHRPEVPVIASPPNVAADENWDDDNVTYKPDISKKTHIITKCKGATPSERRKHRMEGVKTYRPQQGDEPRQ